MSSVAQQLPFSYALFGIKLDANRPLPGLVPLPASAGAEVRLWWGGAPPRALGGPAGDRRLWYVSASRDARGRPILRVWELGGGAWLHLQYLDGAEFLVDGCGSQVWARETEDLTPDDLLSYLLGPVLSLVLRLRGITCLHASAIAVGDEAIAFLGPTGTGKSSTAAAFAGRGYPVLSDDLVALWESATMFLAAPGFPWLRLRPGSVEALSVAAWGRPRLIPTRDGQYVDLDLTQRGYRFQAEPLPLAGIYLLDEPSSDPAAPRIEASSGAEALISLVANTWTTRVLDRTRRAQEFELLGRVATSIPCRRVRVDADPARLSQLCDAIEEDLDRRYVLAPRLRSVSS